MEPLEQIEQFCSFHSTYHHTSVDHTQLQRRTLKELLAHLNNEPFTELTGHKLQSYFLECTRQGLAPRTVGQRKIAIGPFIKWLWQNGQISAQQLIELREVELPRGAKARSIPKPYTRREIEGLWKDLDRDYPWCERGTKEDTLQNAQYYLDRWMRGTSAWKRVEKYAKRLQMEAIVSHALYGCLRRQEIFNLNLEDIHPDNAYVAVHSVRKNRAAEERDRGVPWTTDEYRDANARWLEFRNILKPGHDRPWLSLSRIDFYLNPMCFRRFKVLLTDLGDGWEYHRLRHTGATELLRAGMPVEQLQKLLGHSNITETLSYAQILERDVVAAARKTQGEFTEALSRKAA